MPFNTVIEKKPPLSKYLAGNINNIYVRHWKHQGQLATSSTTGTLAIIAKAPCREFTHVRMILKNGEASPPTIDGALFAVTTSNTNKIVPTTGNTLTEDASTGWKTVTFAGSATGTLATTGASSTYDFGVTYSDWIEVNSIAPTDGTTLPYIMARIKLTGAFTANTSGGNAGDNTKASYLESATGGASGISSPSGMTTGTNSSGTPYFGFEFKGPARTIKVLCVGDSITQGQNATLNGTHMHSWVPRAQEYFDARSIPVNMINYGYSGRTTTDYAIFGKRAIDNHLPSIVFYSVYSPNDTNITQAISNAQYARAMDFAYYALSKNCLPVLLFLAPNDNYALATDDIRKALITRCKTAAALGGFEVCDMTTVLGDTASPQRFLPDLRFDTLHPNDAGYEVMYPVAVATIQNIISKNISWG